MGNKLSSAIDYLHKSILYDFYIQKNSLFEINKKYDLKQNAIFNNFERIDEKILKNFFECKTEKEKYNYLFECITRYINKETNNNYTIDEIKQKLKENYKNEYKDNYENMYFFYIDNNNQNCAETIKKYFYKIKHPFNGGLLGVGIHGDIINYEHITNFHIIHITDKNENDFYKNNEDKDENKIKYNYDIKLKCKKLKTVNGGEIDNAMSLYNFFNMHELLIKIIMYRLQFEDKLISAIEYLEDSIFSDYYSKNKEKNKEYNAFNIYITHNFKRIDEKILKNFFECNKEEKFNYLFECITRYINNETNNEYNIDDIKQLLKEKFVKEYKDNYDNRYFGYDDKKNNYKYTQKKYLYKIAEPFKGGLLGVDIQGDITEFYFPPLFGDKTKKARYFIIVNNENNIYDNKLGDEDNQKNKYKYEKYIKYYEGIVYPIYDTITMKYFLIKIIMCHLQFEDKSNEQTAKKKYLKYKQKYLELKQKIELKK